MPTACGCSASPSRPLYRPLRIGLHTAAGNVLLAPMAGYTDAPFRSVCIDAGAPLCFTEMVSAEALARGSAKTMRLLERAPNEADVAFQIFAAGPRAAAAAVRLIAPLGPLVIDLNCGCSVAKVLRTGCGAALLRDPALVGSIVAAMRSETDLPVSVKLRSGWDSASATFMDCAGAAVAAGAAMVTLHPRTRAQGFTGRSRWEQIAELRAALAPAVSVVGSGDLFTPEDCRDMLARTGCDGVMIARGCLGNPFIFAETRALLEGRPAPAPPAHERLSAALRHLRLLADAVGEPKACRDMRKHFVAYTKGLEGGAAMRQAAVHAAAIADYERLVEDYLRERPGH
jgi:tRNA-dihydrouridine synthase B